MDLIEHTFPVVRITDKAVMFDGQELPWHIAKDGIRFDYGPDISTLTIDFLVERVEFLVGETTFRSQWEINHDGEWQWLKRAVALEFRVQQRAFDRIEKEFNVRG